MSAVNLSLAAPASPPALGSEAAIYFNPNSPQEMARAIASVLTSPALRKNLSEKGKNQAAKFRWRQTAKETWATLLSAAASSS